MLGNIFYPNEKKKRIEKVLPCNESGPQKCKGKSITHKKKKKNINNQSYPLIFHMNMQS